MNGLRPEDTHEGRAILQEQAWLDSQPPLSPNSRDLLVAQLLAALRPLAEAYPDDPGTSDLYNDQPVTVTLGDVRRAWAALAAARRAE